MRRLRQIRSAARRNRTRKSGKCRWIFRWAEKIRNFRKRCRISLTKILSTEERFTRVKNQRTVRYYNIVKIQDHLFPQFGNLKYVIEVRIGHGFWLYSLLWFDSNLVFFLKLNFPSVNLKSNFVLKQGWRRITRRPRFISETGSDVTTSASEAGNPTKTENHSENETGLASQSTNHFSLSLWSKLLFFCVNFCQIRHCLYWPKFLKLFTASYLTGLNLWRVEKEPA